MVVDVVLPAVLGLVHVRKASVGAYKEISCQYSDAEFDTIELFAESCTRFSSGWSLPAAELLASGQDQTMIFRGGIIGTY